jgi:CHRD domain-containing protein
MKRVSLAVVLAVLAAGCGSSSTAPSNPANPTFTATLLPANEVPPITNAEKGASGTATITLVLTPPTGTLTSAVGTAVVNLTGFPAGSVITLAHIHTGAAGVPGGVFVGFVPPPGSVTLTNGAGSFTQTQNLTADQATSIMTNPGGFYFNVHTALNPVGVMRGQLVRTQ